MTAIADTPIITAPATPTAVPSQRSVTDPTATSRPRPGAALPGLPQWDSQAIERVRDLLRVSRPGPQWWRELDARLRDLSDRLAAAAADAAGGTGWHAQVVADAPHLRSTVVALAADHAAIVERISEIRARLAVQPADPRWAPREITAVADLLDRVERHGRRSRAALTDAYLLDLGGE